MANDWTPYAKPQPDTGQFWIGITEMVRGTVPRPWSPIFRKCVCTATMPHAWRIAKKRRFTNGMTVWSLSTRRNAQACKLCADTCPHDAIFFNENLNIAQKCTGCSHLLDNDEDLHEPRCVDACPTEALKFGEESDLKELIEKAELLNPRAGTQSRVYYLNLPKKWVAGTVYDPVEKEVVIGAACTLTDTEGGSKYETSTDNFGDFWFRGWKTIGQYKLGYQKG